MNKLSMDKASWSAADLLARMLEPAERDAVRGDLVECGATGTQVFREILGLVARRQASLWMNARPWLILVTLIAPLSLLLSTRARFAADGSSIYLWMYFNNWHWSYIEMPGFWYVLGEVAPALALSLLTLACFSWAAGFVIGAVSRRLLRINTVLFSLLLLLGVLAGVPLYQAFLLRIYQRILHAPLHADPNAVVFALIFYRVVFPIIVLVLLVVLPALWGMGEGPRITGMRPGMRRVLWFAAAASLGVMLLQQPGVLLFVFLATRHPFQLLAHRTLQLLQIVVYWPVAYLTIVKLKRRFRYSAPAPA